MEHKIVKGGFRKRDLPLSPDYRPMYKMGLIVLILALASRENKSSLNKLHLLIWSLKSEKNMAFIRMAFMSKDNSKIISWGVEPALNKALLYAVAEDLLSLSTDKYQLTKKGIAFSKLIANNDQLFTTEKHFLNYIGKQKVTEEYINKLTEKHSN